MVSARSPFQSPSQVEPFFQQDPDESLLALGLKETSNWTISTLGWSLNQFHQTRQLPGRLTDGSDVLRIL